MVKTNGHISINFLFERLKNSDSNYLDIYSLKGKERKMFGDVYQDVLKVIHQMNLLQLTYGSRIGIIGTSCYEYVIIDLACVLSGIYTVPLDPNIGYEAVEAIETFKLDVLLTNLKDYGHGNSTVKTFQKLCSGNQTTENFVPFLYQNDDVFTSIFSSGSNGKPKESNVHVKCFEDQFTHGIAMYGITELDKMLVFLPLHIYLERCYIYLAILRGFNLVMGEPNFIVKVLKNDQITFTVGVPFFFESMMDLFLAQVEGNEDLKNNYRQFISRGSQSEKDKVFAPFKIFWGGNIRFLLTGSAPCKISVLEFYQSMGVPLYEGYGMSEIAGMISLNYPGSLRIGSVGKIFPGKKITIDENSQILVSGEFVANHKYLNQPDFVSQQVFLDNGVISTGDTGYIDADGFLYLTGRCNNVIVLSNGKKVYPEFVEAKLNNEYLIKDCAIFGNGKHGLSALIITKDPEVEQQKIRDLVRRVNEELPKDGRIIYFEILADAFSIENGMLSSNYKINRVAIRQKYNDIIENMYE